MNFNLVRIRIAELINPNYFRAIAMQRPFPRKIEKSQSNCDMQGKSCVSNEKLQTYFCVTMFCKSAGENNR